MAVEIIRVEDRLFIKKQLQKVEKTQEFIKVSKKTYGKSDIHKTDNFLLDAF